MVVKKETRVVLETTDNKVLREGQTYAFVINRKPYFATYCGLAHSGSIRFKEVVGDIKTDFVVMPKTIETIYECEVEING